MSRKVLKRAIVKHLTSAMTLSDNGTEIDSVMGGQPHPRAGNVFFGVHSGYWSGKFQMDACLDEEMEVVITLSLRGTHVPGDRWGGSLLDVDEDGLDFLTRLAIVRIHENWDVMNIANDLLQLQSNHYLGGAVSIFAEPLHFAGCDEPTARDAGWWHGAPQTNSMKPEGVSQSIRFAGARRIQTMVLDEKN